MQTSQFLVRIEAIAPKPCVTSKLRQPTPLKKNRNTTDTLRRNSIYKMPTYDADWKMVSKRIRSLTRREASFYTADQFLGSCLL